MRWLRSLAIDVVSVYNLCVSLILEELCAIIYNWCTSLSISTLMCGLLVCSFISFNNIITILAWYHQFRVIERVLLKRPKPVHTSHYMNLIPVRAPLMGGTCPAWYTPCWFFILGKYSWIWNEILNLLLFWKWWSNNSSSTIIRGYFFWVINLLGIRDSGCFFVEVRNEDSFEDWIRKGNLCYPSIECPSFLHVNLFL